MNIDLNSLDPKSHLNNDIWHNRKLNQSVKRSLLKIAEDFFKELDIPWAELDDIYFTGSLANYNWSKYSDIDLHLMVDYSLVSKNEDFIEAYFTARKNLWNNDHNITISGFDVEVYVEDTQALHMSTGIYSILFDKWITKPQSKNYDIDKNSIKRKSNVIMRLAKDLIFNKIKENDFIGAIKSAESMTEKLKKMRKAGLERNGEYSIENLTYKILRRNGFLEKLWNAKIHAYDQMMTIK